MSASDKRALILYAHPNPKSFNHALLETVLDSLEKAGATAKVKDLYAMQFKSVLDAEDLTRIKAGDIPQDIKQEQNDLLWATHLIFIYPIWWMDRPAILKGWFDRVFLYGFAHKSGQGLLKHERALVLQTTGEPAAFYTEGGKTPAFHETVAEGSLGFCGIDAVKVHTFYQVITAGDEGRKAMLAEAEGLLREFIA